MVPKAGSCINSVGLGGIGPAETTNYFEIKIKENAFNLLQP